MKTKKLITFFTAVCILLSMTACGNNTAEGSETTTISAARESENSGTAKPLQTEAVNIPANLPEDFVLIKGGTFLMGSPETENWRGEDETQHTVTVSDFAMCVHEVTQAEYESIVGSNPSSFTGENFPVDSVSWIEAATYCNLRSEAEGLSPVYQIDGETVTWDRTANGYRLPTEAEWEYACRAGTVTPFNTETSISAEEANYYGHYPYEIEENYFSQSNLETKPGEYRQTTVAVQSFSPNGWGLYDMHGNVGEWVWDYYGSYPAEEVTDPVGAESGTLRVNRGGGWNDFAKNIRSAYRAAAPQDQQRFNVGIRLVLGAVSNGSAVSVNKENVSGNGGNVLIAYFSWGGNTRGIAEEIARQTGADLFEIECVTPYSTDYNTVLEEAQHDQNIQARPELAAHVENMDEYDTVILGYPNWWASIPMPVASFLEEYDFTDKTIVPFCSHGGGRFGQSLTAIAKLAPDSVMGEGLSVHYSGGSTLPQDVSDWLELNGIPFAE